jgi:hypothetical protein
MRREPAHALGARQPARKDFRIARKLCIELSGLDSVAPRQAFEAEGAHAICGGGRMAEREGERLGKGSAADLLSNWRAAERDRVAAEETASVASLAASAAAEARTAAAETSEAARLSLEAAQRAQHAARRTADAANVAASAATRDSAAAHTALDASKAAETEARDRFQDAQSQGFPKNGATT